jgi:hypothetical protein
MGKLTARRIDATTFEGRSLHDDDLGGASVDEALDALARHAVLTTISEDERLRGIDEGEGIVADALDAIARLEQDDATHVDNRLAKDVSRRAAEKRYPERPYELEFRVQLDIVTRPYNQWVRDIVATGKIGG